MKSNKTYTRTTVLVLIITLLALIALAGTYAKYTSSTNATGTAIVGKWDLQFKQGATELTNGFQIDLARTMSSKDKANAFIQPGSKGSFVVTVDNKGQVPASITASVADKSATVFTDGQFTLTVDNEANGATIAAGEKKNITITWEWKYDKDNAGGADTADTKLGKETTGTAKTLCTIDLTATQVDPNA